VAAATGGILSGNIECETGATVVILNMEVTGNITNCGP
jgi:hypothetical protein